MKQRLLVMNGQKIVQNDSDGTWTTHKVDKAGALRPGIYNLYLAASADKAKQYDGVILHADDQSVFQQIGRFMVRHAAQDFPRVPDVGASLSIKYQAGLVLATPSTLTHSRKLSR